MSIGESSIFQQKWCESGSNEVRSKYGASTEQVRRMSDKILIITLLQQNIF